MGILNINPYDETLCRQVVERYLPALKDKYSKYIELDFRKIYDVVSLNHQVVTPRQKYLTKHIPCAAFYYLNFLLEINPNSIIDVGCGMNFFKEVIPNIVGVDPDLDKHKHLADFIHLPFAEAYSVAHHHMFEAAFAINSIHFIPITEFSQQILFFKNMIKPGGRGYLGMNACRMLEFTPSWSLMELFDTEKPTNDQVERYIDEQIRSLDIDFIVVDTFVGLRLDEAVDGNVRLVFNA